MALGETNEVASNRLSPAAMRASIRAIFSGVGTFAASFWRPSRGPTSTISTDAGRSTRSPLPPKAARSPRRRGREGRRTTRPPGCLGELRDEARHLHRPELEDSEPLERPLPPREIPSAAQGTRVGHTLTPLSNPYTASPRSQRRVVRRAKRAYLSPV